MADRIFSTPNTSTETPNSRSVRFSCESKDSSRSNFSSNGSGAPRPRRKRRKTPSSIATSSSSVFASSTPSPYPSICRTPIETPLPTSRSSLDSTISNGSTNSASSTSSSSSHRKCYSGRIRIRNKKDTSYLSSSTFDTPDGKITGASTDVLAVQDAGSYRLWSEHCSYLSGTLSSMGGGKGVMDVVKADASCQLAHMVSFKLQRGVLLGQGSSGCVTVLLDALSCAPEKSSVDNDGDGNTERVARGLAVMIYFISTEIEKNSHLRRMILDHKGALAGLARLCHFDDVIDANLISKNKNNSNDDVIAELKPQPNHSQNGFDDDVITELKPNPNIGKSTGDPTKSGRRTRKKKRGRTTTRSELSFDSSSLNTINENKPLFSCASPLTSPGFTGKKLEFQMSSILSTPCTTTTTTPTSNSASVTATPSTTKLSPLPTSITSTDKEDSLKKLNDALSRVSNLPSPPSNIITSTTHSCHHPQCPCCSYSAFQSTSIIALSTLKRILSMRGDNDDDDDNDTSGDCLENGTEINNNNNNNNNNIDDNEFNCSSPFHANVALRASGSLPILATAMTTTISCLLHNLSSFHQSQSSPSSSSCPKCMAYFNIRLNLLVDILDDACCLSADNRRDLCHDNLHLISHLVQVIEMKVTAEITSNAKLHSQQKIQSNAVGQPYLYADQDHDQDTADLLLLAVLQTLTSITHENELAGLQLLQSPRSNPTLNPSHCQTSSGIQLIFSLLYTTVTMYRTNFCNDDDHHQSDNNIQQQQQQQQQHETKDKKKTYYDTIIYCLNALTNTVETTSNKGARQILYNITFEQTVVEEEGHHQQQESELGLTWLTRYLVSQTDSYKDQLLKGSFGKPNNANDKYPNNNNNNNETCERELEKHEEEALVVAGNGFVLLSCLMKRHNSEQTKNMPPIEKEEDEKLTRRIRQVVLDQMPHNEESGASLGVVYIIRTLKAFLNFYHNTIGALSVAVATPVVRLIEELETIV